MIVLLQGIQTHFKTSVVATTLRTLINAIYLGRAPNNVKYPFVEVRIPTEASGLNSSCFKDEPSVEFHTWDSGRNGDRALTIAAELETVFRTVDFPLTGGQAIVISNKDLGILLEEPDSKGWHHILTIGYEINRNR